MTYGWIRVPRKANQRKGVGEHTSDAAWIPRGIATRWFSGLTDPRCSAVRSHHGVNFGGWTWCSQGSGQGLSKSQASECTNFQVGGKSLGENEKMVMVEEDRSESEPGMRNWLTEAGALFDVSALQIISYARHLPSFISKRGSTLCRCA